MKPRILSVDDHEDTLSVLRVMLGSCGYELATAPSVAEGLRLAESGGFDLFLLDFRFADGTGKELCERIREFDRETPVLFFSGIHPTQHRGAESCGAQAFVMKPDFAGLRREIRQAVGGGSVGTFPLPPHGGRAGGRSGGVQVAADYPREAGDAPVLADVVVAARL